MTLAEETSGWKKSSCLIDIFAIKPTPDEHPPGPFRQKAVDFWLCHGEVRTLQSHLFQPGDFVIYTVSKQSPHPGPRARSIHPSEAGEDYRYLVDKFWMVAEVRSDDTILLITRKGKTRTVSVFDPQLRKANWWQRFRYKSRFPSPEILQNADEAHAATTT